MHVCGSFSEPTMQGIIYAVTLAAPTGQMFEGFFVQSRLAADDTTRVGVFAVDDADNSRLSSCVTDTVNLTLFFNSLLGAGPTQCPCEHMH